MDDFSPTPKKSRTGLILLIIVLLALAGGAYYYFSTQSKKTQKQVAITPTAEPTAQPTDTPTATPSGAIKPTVTTAVTPTTRPTTGEVKKATELNLQVLNGSGTVGVAGEVRDYLAGKGYKNIDTGNADNFDYKNLTIKIKTSRQEFLTEIQTALKEKYTISDSATLSTSSPYDVVVIVGK